MLLWQQWHGGAGAQPHEMALCPCNPGRGTAAGFSPTKNNILSWSACPCFPPALLEAAGWGCCGEFHQPEPPPTVHALPLPLSPEKKKKMSKFNVGKYEVGAAVSSSGKEWAQSCWDELWLWGGTFPCFSLPGEGWGSPRGSAGILQRPMEPVLENPSSLWLQHGTAGGFWALGVEEQQPHHPVTVVLLPWSCSVMKGYVLDLQPPLQMLLLISVDFSWQFSWHFSLYSDAVKGKCPRILWESCWSASCFSCRRRQNAGPRGGQRCINSATQITVRYCGLTSVRRVHMLPT